MIGLIAQVRHHASGYQSLWTANMRREVNPRALARCSSWIRTRGKVPSATRPGLRRRMSDDTTVADRHGRPSELEARAGCSTLEINAGPSCRTMEEAWVTSYPALPVPVQLFLPRKLVSTLELRRRRGSGRHSSGIFVALDARNARGAGIIERARRPPRDTGRQMSYSRAHRRLWSSRRMKRAAASQ